MSDQGAAARPRRERRLWGPDLRRDVDDEIAFHLQERERELTARGVPLNEARAEAARRFGNVKDIAAACRQIDHAWHREQRRASMWNDLRQDLAFSLRTLFKSRGFAVTAIVTLALGIGANTAIFSVINGVLFRTLPFNDPGRLVLVWSTSEAFAREPLTPGRLIDFREQISSLSAAAGISHIPLNLTGGGDPERLGGSSVSSSFFDVLGAPALLGDPFHTGTANDRDVVLSYGLWIRRFGGDRSIVGKQIVLNGSARTVVAVMPPDFDWPAITATPGRAPGPELWIPGTVRDVPRMPNDREDIASDRSSGYLRMVARLKPGVSIDQARQEAQAVAVRLGVQYPRDDGGRGAALVPLREQLVGHLREPMLVLFGAVGLVLAIACANIASLLLGRGAARRKEIALRLALGASRGRVVRQLLTESTVLALVSAAVGVLVAWWALQWLGALSGTAVPGIERAGLDSRVLLFTIGLSIVTGLVCGLVPALQSSTFEIAAGLGEESGRVSDGRRSGRTRDILVAAEIAVALMLLVGAGLLLRSFQSLSRVDTGIDARNLLTFGMFLTGARAQDDARQVAFYREALDAVSALPGVRRAAGAVTLPIGGDNFASAFTIEGQPVARPGDEPRAGFQVVTPGYFETMGIRVLKGRDFAVGDDERAPGVVMVNETFVRQRWPGVDPIGRRLRMGGERAPWLTVIGVVSDIRHLGPATPPRPELYQPYTQNSFSFMSFVVRTEGDPAGLVPAIRAAIARLDPAQAISGVDTMEHHLDTALSRPKFLSRLVAAFGLLALILSTVGVYGVMAYSVTQRTREIAIRAALGANRTDVVKLVVSKALWLAAAGIVAGVGGALALSTVLSGLLFGVLATDTGTYAAVVALLGGVAMFAAAVPALRASRIPGAQALRG
jgi:putative ABC transport system permease protein